MTTVRRSLLGIAAFQALSTLVGAVQLLLVPSLYAATLAPTALAGQFVLAGLLLGVAVGGPQWAALVAHRRAPQWVPLTHAVAGTVMLGWIAGECLVLDSFIWPHALWGGIGAVQLVLVSVLLGVLRPWPAGEALGATAAARPAALR